MKTDKYNSTLSVSHSNLLSPQPVVEDFNPIQTLPITSNSVHFISPQFNSVPLSYDQTSSTLSTSPQVNSFYFRSPHISSPQPVLNPSTSLRASSPIISYSNPSLIPSQVSFSTTLTCQANSSPAPASQAVFSSFPVKLAGHADD